MLRAALLLVLCAAAVPLATAPAAQSATRDAAPRFERFGVREGLSNEHIRAIAQDTLGFLWIGTRDALNRYDGHGFRIFRLGESGLPGREINSLLVDDAGALWVATDGGAAVLDWRSGRFRRVPLPDAPVLALATDAEGGVWAGTAGRGLFYRAPGTGVPPWRGPWRPLRVTGDAATDAALSVRMLVSTAAGVWAELGGSLPSPAALVDPVQGARQTIARAEGSLVGPDQDGRLALVRSGLGQLSTAAPGEAGRGRLDPAIGGIRGTMPLGPFAKVADGRWWLGTPDGLVEWNRTAGTTRRIRDAGVRREGRRGLGEVQVVFRDRQDGVWVGTTSGLYLSRVRALPFQTFRHDPADPATLSDDRVNGMSVDADGLLWVTTNDGLNRLDLARGAVERLDLRLAQSVTGQERAFWTVLHTRAGETYVGPKGAVTHRLGGGRLVPLHAAELAWTVEGDPIETLGGTRTLAEDAAGRVWTGYSNGLQRIDPGGASPTSFVLDGSITSFGGLEGDRGLTDARTNIVYPARDGRIWIGTDDGLFLHDAETDTVRFVGQLCGPATWSITEAFGDPGALWMSTFGTGLARLDLRTGRVRCVTTEDGLPSDLAYSVVSDERGSLWAGTAAGLVRVELDRGGAPGRVSVFNAEDGIQGDDHNFMSALRLPDGRLAFGGPTGLTVFDPAAIARRASDARTVFTGVEVLGALRDGVPLPGDTLRLGHDENFFGVRFATLDFRAPGRHRYRYRLDGVDADWRQADAESPRASYTDVPPGTYRFEVIGTTHRGDEGTDPAVLTVRIVPAWWQTWWARALGALGLLALAVGATLGATRRRVASADARRREAIEVQRRLADGRERERRRLARDLHDGPVQGLYRIGHDLDALERVAGPSAPSIQDTRARLGEISGELREMLGQLRPTLALHLPLPDALDALVARFERRHGVAAETAYPADGEDAADASRLVLFRIAQEALENVARHAEATTVWVRVDRAEGGLRLRIEDDGRGFDVPERLVAFAREAHYGLVGMAERAESVGGRLRVTGRPGGGTRVEAVVPLRVEGEPR